MQSVWTKVLVSVHGQPVSHVGTVKTVQAGTLEEQFLGNGRQNSNNDVVKPASRRCTRIRGVSTIVPLIVRAL